MVLIVTIMITMMIVIDGHKPVDDADLETMMTRNKLIVNDDDDAHYYNGGHDGDEDIEHGDDDAEDTDD